MTALVLALVLTKGCHETSESGAVGLANCHTFGNWDASPWKQIGFYAPEVGLGIEHFVLDASAAELCAPVGRSCLTVMPLAANALGHAAYASPAVSTTQMVRFGLIRVGVHFRFATLPAVQTAGPTFTVSNPTSTIAGVSVGSGVRFRRVTASLDVLVGINTISADVGSLAFYRTIPVAEPRASLLVWLTPITALRLTAGLNLVEPSHFTFELSMRVPWERPYEGRDG
jgi:hypothetical protein